MSEKSWVLKGVDTEIRQRAIEEAERRGVPLGEYLSDVVMRATLAEQAPGRAAVPPEREAPSATAPIENFPGRYRGDALEHFSLAVEALDDVVRALDGSVYGLAARVGEAEALAAANAEQLNQTLQDAGDHLTALHQRLANAEEQTETLGRAQEAMGETFAARSIGLLQQAAAAEEAAHAANATAARLATQQETLKYAVADDFSAFAHESAARLGAGLDEVRAVADTAAERADAAVSDVVRGLRAMSDAVDARLGESATEIADLRDQQATGAARLKQLDAASASLESDVTAMRRTMDARVAQGEEAVRAVLALAQADWDARHEALRADGERVEACVLAALEKVADDRAAGDAALHRELADVRDQASGASARLTLLDRAIGARDLTAAIEAGAAPLSTRLAHIEAVERELDARLLHLEAAQESEEAAHALAALRGQIGAMAVQLDAQEIEGAQLLEELRSQLGEAAGQAAQNGQAEERLHKLELAVADLRLETPPGESAAAGAEAFQDIERRVAEFEQRQEAAIEQLRGDIAHFIDENARRLEALEQPAPSAIADDFEALRRRIEERMLDVEQRSVRALEQVVDTMAILEQRFSADPEAMLRSA